MSRIQNVAIAVLFIITTVSAQAGSIVKGPDGGDIIINNNTPPVPISPVTEINKNTSTTVTPKPDTTPVPTTASTEKSTEKTTVTTTSASTTAVPTTASTTKPSTSSVKPSVTTATTLKPTGAPPTTPVPSHRRFDGPSFIGGIVLALGLVAIGFVAFKFYKARTELNYHTL